MADFKETPEFKAGFIAGYARALAENLVDELYDGLEGERRDSMIKHHTESLIQTVIDSHKKKGAGK